MKFNWTHLSLMLKLKLDCLSLTEKGYQRNNGHLTNIEDYAFSHFLRKVSFVFLLPID